VSPLLTVCVITYNHSQYIRECLDTLLAQELSIPWQIVIADDYSTDGTREILKKYQTQYPNLIRLILQKKNIGAEQNWLELMSYPKSQYVLYTEGDDYLIDSKKLQRQVDFLDEHPDFGICFHPVNVIYDDHSKADEIFPTPDQRFHKGVLDIQDLLVRNFMQTNSVMYRWHFTKRDIRKEFPSGIVPGDWFLHMIHAKTGKIGFINSPMAVYRRHPGGLWWEASRGNIDEIWKRYGVAHLKLFIEMEKLLGSAPNSTIEEHIHQMYDAIIRTDKTNDQGQLLVAVKQFPETTERYIRAVVDGHERAISELRNHADEQAKIISHIESANMELQVRVSHPIKTALRARLSTKPSHPA